MITTLKIQTQPLQEMIDFYRQVLGVNFELVTPAGGGGPFVHPSFITVGAVESTDVQDPMPRSEVAPELGRDPMPRSEVSPPVAPARIIQGEVPKAQIQMATALEGVCATAKIGTTELSLVLTSGTQPFYHFAIDIPENQLSEAAQWLEGRVPILSGDHGWRFEFEDWNASSLYFHDPAGNIVEFIGRHNLKTASEEPFSSSSLLRISEIGMPGTDPCGLPVWRDYGHFKALGTEMGLVLVVPVGRGWLPTGRPAEAHPCSVEMRIDGHTHQVGYPA